MFVVFLMAMTAGVADAEWNYYNADPQKFQVFDDYVIAVGTEGTLESVEASDIITALQAGKEIRLRYVEVQRDLTFLGEIRRDVYFVSTTFTKDADFKSARFLTRDADFSSARFKGNADIGSATFTGNADFSSAEFAGNVSFGSATFTGSVDFSSARFTGSVNFGSATFTGSVDFSSATFTGGADFNGATFAGSANFSSATFTENADFSSASFTGGTDGF